MIGVDPILFQKFLLVVHAVYLQRHHEAAARHAPFYSRFRHLIGERIVGWHVILSLANHMLPGIQLELCRIHLVRSRPK